MEIDKAVEWAKIKIHNEATQRVYISLHDDIFYKISKEVFEIVEGTFENRTLSSLGIKKELDIPPTTIDADFALPLFNLAKLTGQKIEDVSKKLEEVFNAGKSAHITNAKIVGPFLNLSLNKQKIYEDVLLYVAKMGDGYGESDAHAREVVVLDYSSPNIAKPIGVGHLRSTVIGQALANIYEKTGFTTIRDNHLGDWGSQFGELVYAYKHWGNDEEIKKDPIRALKDLYVQFHAEVQKNPEIKEVSRELFKKLESGDVELLRLWAQFRKLSVVDFEKTYERLDVNFDIQIGESYFVSQSDTIVHELIKKGLATELGVGIVVVDFGILPSFLLRKKDGSSLYMTRDIATLKFRMKQFHPSVMLYVVGSEQELSFKQLFELCRRANYFGDDTEVKHVGFGMVLTEGKKMSTRRGTVIELEQLLSESVEKAKKLILEKNKGLSEGEINTISEMVGIGAVIYNDLSQSRGKNISFDWDKMLNFETGSAAYLQYTYARTRSILLKTESSDDHVKKIKKYSFEHKSEFDLAKKIMLFPSIIIRAQQENAPHLIAVYLEELAQLFNTFYQSVSVLKTDKDDLRASRVGLTFSTGLVIKNGLKLLGIKVPEQM